MDRYFTHISKTNIIQITKNDMTPEEIVEFLKNGALYRSFADLIKWVYPGDDLNEKLVHGLTEISGKDEDSISLSLIHI